MNVEDERQDGRKFLGIFDIHQPAERRIGWADVIIVGVLVVLVYGGVRVATSTPEVVSGPHISLSPKALPYYTLCSIARMTAAYAISLTLALIYGHAAAYNRHAEQVLMPLLDVLQSIPILSFLPVVLLSLSAVLPERIAIQLSSILLIVTSQVWNLIFSWYQSLTTIPTELREASTIFRFNAWLRLRKLELPFAGIGLIWNSMMSWAGGWFFLMAAEIFTVGKRDFRLPGLGAYLHEAANQESWGAIGRGLAALILIIVLLDQLVWRPLLAWSDRFKLDMTESDHPPTSWFYTVLRDAHTITWLNRAVAGRLFRPLDLLFTRRSGTVSPIDGPEGRSNRRWIGILLGAAAGVGLIYGLYLTGQMLVAIPATRWEDITLGLGATLLRVSISLLIALIWTIPVGVAIGTNPRLAAVLQPVVQITASIPATALFPALLLVLLNLPGGLNIAAMLLMLMGTQWYLLFNIIAGASAIPQDLKYTSTLLRLNRWRRWRTLILPALFPYVITGAITASGGAWNASIVAEFFQLGGRTLSTTGLGALIARSTASGDYHTLLGSTVTMILAVILINRLVWRRLYRRAEERFRME